MNTKRCAFAAAVVLTVCAVAFWCRNQSVSEVKNVAEESIVPARATASAAPAAAAALAAPPSNQTATVRGTKPYVLTGERNFNKPLRLAVEALGARPVGVLARKSLLVEADAAAVARLRADRRFSVEREFLPSDKIAPDLAARISGGAEAVEVSVVTLSADDHRRVQDRVVARGGEILAGCFNEGDSFRARLPASLVSELASFGDVRWMEVFNRPQPLNNLAVTTAAMNVEAAWNVSGLGLSGAGQNISTSDSGIDTGVKETMHADLRDQVAGIKVVAGCLDHDESGHGTHTAGSIVGTGAMWTNATGKVRGTAWGAQLYAWFCGREDGKLGMPTTMAELFRGDAEGAEWDAYIHSASWGSEGSAGVYDVQCKDIDSYVWDNPEFLPVFAAGNEGDKGARTISSPASAKNVLAVGATQNLRKDHDGGWGNGDPTVTATFSSRGPCQDGRIKPDVAAPGVGILSTRAFGVDYKTYGIYDDYYAYDSGTSMACPLTAGAVALVREWLVGNPETWKVEGEAEIPTAALMKAIVTGGAKDAAYPNNDQGWGRVDVRESLSPSGRAVKLIDRIPFADGEEFTWVVETTNDAPFDVQLAWIDLPGTPSASQTAPMIVNDLNLAVQKVSDGELYYGNGGAAPDELNTLESVRIGEAAATRYYITVSCPNVYADHTEGGAAALYIRGAFDPETVEPYSTVRVRHGSAEKGYSRLDKALNEAKGGDVIEILDNTELRESVTLTNDFALTIVATNADPYASRIARRNGADILVRNGSLLFSNVVFQTEPTTPVRACINGVVRVAGLAVFDDIVSRTPGILTDRPEGFELAGRILNGITVDCTGASADGSPFGVYSCPFAVAAESAPRLISTSGEHRAGVADGAGVLKWSDAATVDPEVAVGYVDGATPVYYRTLDQLFDEHPNGTNVVLTKSGLALRTPRTLSGRQSISAEDGVGEIVVYPTNSAGFVLSAGCRLTVSGITFEGYTGNGLFVVNGEGAKLTVTDSVFRDIEGTNKWSGAIAILKGDVKSVDTDFENCRATGMHKVRMPNGNLIDGTVTSKGGAIYLEGKDCSLDLNGGKITGCFAKSGGGGVYANAGSSVSVRGALTVRDNLVEDKTKRVNDIELQNTTATLTLAGKLDGTDSVGVRYGTSSSDRGNGVGKKFAAVAAGTDYVSSLKAFFSDTDPDGTKAVADKTGDNLLWAVRTPGDRNVDPDDVDATIRVKKGGVTQYYVEPEYAFDWIDADATVEILKDAGFGGDLVVTNGVKVTLKSSGSNRFTLTRTGEVAIRVLPDASLKVTNAVLDGNGANSTVGLVKVEGAALELQAGATVRNVAGSADRASGAISVQKKGTFTMRSGAEILNCKNSYVNAGSKDGYGAGLLVEDDSTANLLGGSIIGCAANRGGGVFIGTKSTVNIAGDMTIEGNLNLDRFAKSDNLCVADLSGLKLIGPLTGKIGYNEGRSGDTNVFGMVDADFSGTPAEMQASAHNFTHDVTGDVGMAVTDGTKTLLVWGNALDADGTYDDTYELVDGEACEIAVPSADNFFYDGTEKTCLTDGIGYRVLAGNVATNIGNYVAVVTTRAGFAWEGGTSGQKNIPWKIEAVPYELKGVTFEDVTFKYDGTMKHLALTGTLPAGFSVEFLNNGRWQPGTNEVEAVISGSVPNYKPNPFKITLQAKLIIEDPEGKYRGETEPPGPVPPPGPQWEVVTNHPTPIAFKSIERESETEWKLVVTDRVEYCNYRLIWTDDLTKGFTSTGEWEHAVGPAADPVWTTNVITTGGAWFWRAEGADGTNMVLKAGE